MMNNSNMPTKKNKINQFKVKEITENAKRDLNRHIPISIFFATIILIYLLFSFYKIITITPSNAVMVESGKLEEVSKFDALIIRNEENVVAIKEGFMDAFIPTGSTAKKGQEICSVSNNITKRNQIVAALSNEKEKLSSTIEYSTQTQQKIQSFFRDYAVNLNQSGFGITNQVEHELDNILKNDLFRYDINDRKNFDKINGNLELYKEQIKNIGQSYIAEKSSTICFSNDGLEDISIDNFKPEDLKRKPKAFNRLENPNVKQNEFLYRKVDNLYYYFASEIDAVTYNYLDDYVGSYVTLFFPTKNINLTVQLKSLDLINDQYIAVFMADRYINRFLEDRFIPYQIIYNQYSGLKIPNSAIDTKIVWKVPKTAVDYNEKLGNFVKQYTKDSKENDSGVAVRVKIYGEHEKDFFILAIDNPELIKKDSIIYNLNPETKQLEKFVISESEKLKGVYVLNKGFADFKRINILYQSDNFTIVQKHYLYSIKIYDNIASEAKTMTESMVVR